MAFVALSGRNTNPCLFLTSWREQRASLVAGRTWTSGRPLGLRTGRYLICYLTGNLDHSQVEQASRQKRVDPSVLNELNGPKADDCIANKMCAPSQHDFCEGGSSATSSSWLALIILHAARSYVRSSTVTSLPTFWSASNVLHCYCFPTTDLDKAERPAILTRCRLPRLALVIYCLTTSYAGRNAC